MTLQRRRARAWWWLALAALGACDAWHDVTPDQLRTLNTELLAHDSATVVLEHWCDTHHLAAEPRIHAERVAGAEPPADATVRRELGVGAEVPVRYRHVRLRCGTVVLSEADNWYVPSRLTPAMNATLDSTDEPFGRVVQPLHFRRVRRAAEIRWPQQSHAADAPATVLVHRAVLVLPDGTPFSYVVENYQREALRGR